MSNLRAFTIALALLCPLGTRTADAGSAAAGAATFRLNCSPCHSSQRDRNIIGPSLFGVFGRHSASLPSYSYSPAMKASELVWTEANLFEFLQSPSTKLPGTKMTFVGVPDPGMREDLIAFLQSLKAPPD